MAAAEEVEDVGRTIEEVEAVCEKRERRDEGETLTPWEQHASIISIPRFDYKAPSSLLHHSHSGFLVTCTISMIFFSILSNSSIVSELLSVVACVSYTRIRGKLFLIFTCYQKGRKVLLKKSCPSLERYCHIAPSVYSFVVRKMC